jgi:3-hydroxyacyl-CoA dehydrogenase
MRFSRLCCYGTGTIGTGWAVNFLLKDCTTVLLYDLNEEKLLQAQNTVRGMLEFCRDIGSLNEENVEECLSRAHFTTDREAALAGVEIVQENCPENLELKHTVIRDIEEFCSPDTIIASSTSGLLVTDIARFALYPQRIIGAHPYHPVFLMPLVELAKGERSDPECLKAAASFYRELGKEPIVLKKECPGFIANRLQAALNREARDLVFRGVCTVEEVDKAVTFGPGLRWGIIGPHLIFELAGGSGGLRKQATQKGDTIKSWYEDMAAWTTIPEGYVDIACQGLKEEMANRPTGTGRTTEELARFRDRGLVTLLKFHGKI